MKKRILMLFVSVFALTPAVLGSAWGGENRGKNGSKQECELVGGKRLDIKSATIQSAPVPAKSSSQTKIY